MIPESISPVVTMSKLPITSALNDNRYYSTYSSSYNSPSYLTSNSSLIRSYPSKNTNLFADTARNYKLNDYSKCSSTKQFNLDDFSYSRPSRPSITNKYYKPSFEKKLQVSPSTSVSRYQSPYQTSSLPSSSAGTASYLSKTVDSKTLDNNANYRITNGSNSPYLSERKLLNSTKSNSTLGLKKYANDVPISYNRYNNNLNGYSSKNEVDDKKETSLTNSYTRKHDTSTDDSDDNNIEWSGLRNVGNTCYMNSILQCLSSTKLLKEYTISKTFVEDIHKDGKLINAFYNLISKMWSRKSTAADVSAFKGVFQQLAPQFAGYEQHDAQEFLRFLVDKLHADVNRVQTKPKYLPEIDDNLSDNSQATEHWKSYLMSENSYILELFGGQLKSTLQCLVCGNKSVTFEIFWDLSLPLPSYSSYNSNVSVADILDNFTQEEILDHREKPRCSKCKIEQRMAKSYSFQKLPKYLVLHLKRFQTTSSYRKLSTMVQFPLTGLDMSPYLAKAVSSSRIYNLYAVSNHVGTLFTGHYTANCKHPHGTEWFTCNDSSVSKISPPVDSKLVSADAYILFYEAVDL